ncbi:MAG TPA: ABC transporter permease [Acidimicrobiales bacterium]|jgi:rhamnose transport system permease protein|nr:ABC transporter permease [Acidimicrobiales bacterium]
MLHEPATVGPAARGPDASPGSAGTARPWRSLLRWEGALLVLFVGALLYGGAETKEFFTQNTVFYFGNNIGEVAIMALPMALIIITGEIDLSVASMLGLAASVFGDLFSHGVEVWLAMAIVLLVGAAGGALNGFLVTRIGLPSIAVTIGTLTMFRGLAEIVLGNREPTNFPAYLTKIGLVPFPGTKLSWIFVFFLVLAVVYAVVLHATPVGRSIFAIGLQEQAAFFSGIRVKRIKFRLFVLSGVVCAFVGLLDAFKNASVRYDAGTGLELNVVAVVLFGGISIFGGRGTIGGVVLSVLVVGTINEALNLINVTQEKQNIVFGVLLLVSVLLPNGADGFHRLRRRLKRSGRSTRSIGNQQYLPQEATQ